MPLDRTLQRELRLLRAYAAVSGAALIALSVAAFRHSAAPARFDEINVHRINVVEPDGKLRMVISNRAQSIGPIARGKPFGYPGGTRPGIIFFNDEETEDGGLVFEGAKTNGKLQADAQLSFDQYDQDQVVYLRYVDEKGNARWASTSTIAQISGLFEAIQRLDSIPPGPEKDSSRARLMARTTVCRHDAHRVFVGRDPARNASLRLADRRGARGFVSSWTRSAPPASNSSMTVDTWFAHCDVPELPMTAARSGTSTAKSLQKDAKSSRYRGLFPVVPTTFTEAGALDMDSQKRCIDFMIGAGSDGLCILANFSEQFSLSDAERECLTRAIVEHVAGRVPVIVTTTHFGTQVCAERSRRAQDAAPRW